MKRVKSILLSFYLQNLQHSVQNNYIYLFFLHQYLVQYLCKRFFLCHAFKSCWYNQAHLSFSFRGNCGNNRIKLVSLKEAVNQLWYFTCYVANKQILGLCIYFVDTYCILIVVLCFFSVVFHAFQLFAKDWRPHTLINMMPSYVRFKLHLEDQVIRQRYRSCHCM